MVLEVAAAIVGILAAAGKVAETLGPVVLALRQTTKSVGAVLSEVNNAKIILVALQAFLDDLNAAPRRRRQLIQIDQLITALTDGVLLFSELESLVTRLDNPDFALPKRLQWVWNDKEFTSLISRLQNFKNSIILMLNILQCESDKEAQLHRQELLSNTNHLLKSNAELSRRIAFLEDCFDTSNSIHMRQQASRTSTTAYTKDGAHAMLRESNRRISSIPAEGMPCFQFESALGASRVYRKVQRETADFSFRSSMALSHAWSALSDISLSDISLVSVVALPVLMDDITNTHHYTFHEPEDTVEDNVAPTRIDSALELDTTQDLAPTAKPITRLVKTPSGSLKAELQPSTEFKVIVKGAVEAEMNSLIATVCASNDYQT
ncbi:hypothetical protein BKA66DRAFT_476671 [Pyrenochaeta sp. MPI-SDFR-AT-0127]|nr:hypothetical protein BKA66DRAFT_476671 [Pyrenochaeta sp. MPI-SDFR-AT-0127]